MIRLAVVVDGNRVAPAVLPDAGLPPALADALARLRTAVNLAVDLDAYSDDLDPAGYRHLYLLTHGRDEPAPAPDAVIPVHDFMDLVHRYSDSDDELVVAGGPHAWRVFTPYARRVDVVETAKPSSGDAAYDEYENGDFVARGERVVDGGRVLRFDRAHLTAEPHPAP